MTGLTTLSRELSGKRLEMLREARPRVTRMGMLWHRTNEIDALTRRETEEAAPTLGIQLRAQRVDGPDDFDRALSAIVADRAGAALVATSPMFFGHRRRLAELALKHRLPTCVGDGTQRKLFAYITSVRGSSRRRTGALSGAGGRR